MGTLRLPKKIQSVTDDFIRELKNVYGDGLVSVILYGSAASGEYSDRHSNVNIAVVLHDAGIRNLSKMAPMTKKLKFRIINPVFLTEEYIRRSTDVFPIEFLDMKENYAILYGKDVFADLIIDTKNLRFQCEQELKSKLINIKRAYLANRGNAFFGNALFKFFTSTLHILRNIVRLKSGVAVYSKEDIIKEAAREFGIDAPAFNRILAARNKKLKLGARVSEELFFNFVEDLEKITEAVDRVKI